MDNYVIEVLVGVAALLGVYLRKWFLVRLSPTVFNVLLDLARTVVASAEKVGDATGIDGPQKYAVAEAELTTLAKRAGVRLKGEEANALIHAALSEVEPQPSIVLDGAV